MRSNPVLLAIDKFGSQYALANAMGVAQPTIAKWAKIGIVPARRVLLFEQLTGIPRYLLNPSIYPRPD